MVTVTQRPLAGHRIAALGLTVVLALHGIAHFVGLVESFEAAGGGRSVDHLGGVWTVSDPTLLRVLGVVWAVVGTLVVLSAVLVLLRHRLAPPAVLAALLVSLTLSVLGSPAAVVGVGLNVVLLALVVTVPRWVGLSRSS